MQCWTRTITLLCALMGVVFGSVGTASAEKSVTLKVAIVHATKAKTKAPTDPALKKISASLRKNFGKVGYTSFKQVSKQTLSLMKGKAGTIKLPTGNKALVTYKGQTNKRHQIQLAIPKSKVNVALRAPARKLFYQAGIPHKNGILILAFYLKDSK